jgi:hypothetical protein
LKIVQNVDLIDGYLNAFDYKIKAFIAAALIHYRRVFSTGVRIRLRIDDVPSEWMDLHREAIAVADKHTAHSVNEYESATASLGVRIDENGIEVTSVRYGMMGNAEMSAYNFDRLGRLARILVDSVIKERRSKMEAVILRKAKLLSSDQLLALPCGLQVGSAKTPHPAKPRGQ